MAEVREASKTDRVYAILRRRIRELALPPGAPLRKTLLLTAAAVVVGSGPTRSRPSLSTRGRLRILAWILALVLFTISASSTNDVGLLMLLLMSVSLPWGFGVGESVSRGGAGLPWTPQWSL